MSRVAVIERDSAGIWSGFWMGPQAIAAVSDSTAFGCAAKFVTYCGINAHEWGDRAKWRPTRVSLTRWEIEEMQPAGESQPVKRQRRQARVENLGSALVGWWVDRPDEKCESHGNSEANFHDILFKLAHLIKANGFEFLDGVNGERGWKKEMLSPTQLVITEVLAEPDPAAVKCPRCDGAGFYVGFMTVERPCSGCAGKGEVAR